MQTLHKLIPMETRVETMPSSSYHKLSGTVIGIASLGLIYRYIVLLDSPLSTMDGTFRAISIEATSLQQPDGTTFRID